MTKPVSADTNVADPGSKPLATAVPAGGAGTVVVDAEPGLLMVVGGTDVAGSVGTVVFFGGAVVEDPHAAPARHRTRTAANGRDDPLIIVIVAVAVASGQGTWSPHSTTGTARRRQSRQLRA